MTCTKIVAAHSAPKPRSIHASRSSRGGRSASWPRLRNTRAASNGNVGPAMTLIHAPFAVMPSFWCVVRAIVRPTASAIVSRIATTTATHAQVARPGPVSPVTEASSRDLGCAVMELAFSDRDADALFDACVVRRRTGEHRLDGEPDADHDQPEHGEQERHRVGIADVAQADQGQWDTHDAEEEPDVRGRLAD